MYHPIRTSRNLLITCTSVAVLSACGGGGGGGSSTPPNPTNPTVQLSLPSNGTAGQWLSATAQPSQTLESTQWRKVSGPGQVLFSAASQINTQMAFSQPGRYELSFSGQYQDAPVEAQHTLEVRADAQAEDGLISGELAKWQNLQIDFNGPNSDERASNPNPFLDYRYTLLLTAPSGKAWRVPGYFDGDGQGGASGTVFRAKFTPDESGLWQYRAEFRQGTQVAIDTAASAGQASDFDGRQGQFVVTDADPQASRFYREGRLSYAEGHYLKLQDGGYWLKSGTNSPEDWLAYDGFDNTPPTEDFSRHLRFAYHRQDWTAGDPDWQVPETWPRSEFPTDARPESDVPADGKGVIGAINYLAAQNVNSLYFIFMNIGGDGMNAWPYPYSAERIPTQEEFNTNALTDLCTPTNEFLCPGSHPDNDNLHFDLSKMRQWETVFQHAQEKELMLHTVFSEARRYNKEELDGSNALGVERRLYFREMVARFAHHNALQWNISEEYDLDTESKQRDLPNTPQEIIDYANYIAELDAYDHPITVLNTDIPGENIRPFYNQPHFDTTSLQYYETYKTVGQDVERIRQETVASGKPLPINVDEPMWLDAESDSGTPLTKFRHERDDPVMTPEEARKGMIWDSFLSGAAGLEWYSACRDTRFDDKDLGYAPCASQDYQGFRSFEPYFRFAWYARNLLEQNLPFWQMAPNDALLSGETQHSRFGGGEVFAQAGQHWLIYYPDASQTGQLNLAGDAGKTLSLRWYNPRSGEFAGDEQEISASNNTAIPAPPNSASEDWVAWLQVKN